MMADKSVEIAGPTRRAEVVSCVVGWLKHAIGLDRAIGFTILARSWAAGSALVTVALISRFLSPAEQGYYYTFASLVSLQIVFELGFSSVILQMASHERAHLQISSSDEISGDPGAQARLASVLQKSVRWYTIAAILMCLALIPAGSQFFGSHSAASQHVAWRVPWICDVFAATLTFQIDPVFSFLEGCGFVPQVASTRFRQTLTGSLLAWTALALHHGLFAPAMMILGQAVAGGTLLFERRHLLYSLLRHSPGAHKIRWGTEVWPFQWRIAVSWLCGYSSSQIFTPVLFAFWGPIVAGQLGMSFSICNGLASVAVSWISTKAAPFGIMIARRRFRELDTTFFRSVRQAMLVIGAAAIPVWAVVLLLYRTHAHFSSRLVTPRTFACLLVATIVNIAVTAEAIYLRAHKQEKFLPVSIASAMLTVPAAYLFGKHFAAAGIAIGYMSIMIVVNLGWGSYVFQKYRYLWHLEP